MENPTQLRRIRFLLLLTAAVFLVLVGRLWMLQLTHWTKYAQRAAGNRMRIVWEPAPRGLLLDRQGRVLATNRPQWDLEVVPAAFPADREALRSTSLLLAEILGHPEPTVRQSLQQALSERALEAVPLTDLGEDLSLEQTARIEALRVEMPGIRIGARVIRHYPEGRLAAHLLGYARPLTSAQYENMKDLTYPLRDPAETPPPHWRDTIYDRLSVVGHGGVEHLLEQTVLPSGDPLPLLQGRRGYRVYEVNKDLTPQWTIAARDPVPGATVYLSLDSRIQQITEQALDETLSATGSKEAAAILLDVNTGEVLVMASRPTYDPNQWVRGLTPQEWARLREGAHQPLLNRAVAGLYPPGSVYKIISAYAALATTELKLTDHFNCTGRITHGARHDAYRCWNRTGHGMMGYLQGMAQSCDVYFYNLVLSRGLSSDSLAEYSRLFGLGSSTGTGLPGEAEGRVPDRRWKQDLRQEAWFTGDTLHYSIGQGFLTTTPMQMAVATATIANGGFLLQPRLVHKIVWPDWLGYGAQTFTEPRGQDLNLNPDYVRAIKRGLVEAVEGRHGTASVMRGLGVSVAGKTGSAEHKPGRRTHAWFVCFAPADQPRYAAAVLVAEGGYGGAVAAPIARKMIAAALGITPLSSPEGPAASD